MISKPSLVTLLDTSVCNTNLGNQIIIQSIIRELEALFPCDFLMRLQYGEVFGSRSISYLRQSAYAFFGGTNSLSSHMNIYSQMGFRLRDTLTYSGIILFGLGWWQYQGSPNLYTKTLLRRLLSSRFKHSIRDQYTCDKLAGIGILNTLNTSCPTVWGLTTDHCSSIPLYKANSVVTTITDYKKSPRDDIQMINILLKEYAEVFVWLQGLNDYAYLADLGLLGNDRISLVAPNLSNYEQLLNLKDVDYIGTRLHAGIKAIQHGKRTLVLGVDNRACEISKDIGLNVSSRGDESAIYEFIGSPYKTSIQIPSSAIEAWRAQFAPV